MRDRVTLGHDLIDCRGATLAGQGLVISPESIGEAARRAPRLPRLALQDTPHRAEVAGPLEEAQYSHLFGAAAERALVEQALLAVRLPEVLFEELVAVQRVNPALYRHGLTTAAVAVRMLLALVGGLKGVAELAAAALLHDLGMRHLPMRLVRSREGLGRKEAAEIAAHPLLGAYHLASVLGPHPAVAAAHGHHWRCGQGYPSLRSQATRSTEVVAVASAFAALTQPRPYRSAAFDVRAATDLLVAEAKAGTADASTVKLLVNALRGQRGDPRALHFGGARGGQTPQQNRHAEVIQPEPEVP
jgi:HD-GYP domain-containing protein (c-di-GMP phosphodiesterase class II)